MLVLNAFASRLHVSSKPAVLHLGISFTVALLAMVVIFLVWYPGELAEAEGVNRLVLILICVDVMLGPMITLIVFNPAKKYLWVDLMIIATLQTVALLYGISTIFGGRPAYVVFNVDRFDVVAVQDVDRASLEKAMARGEPDISLFGPRWTASRPPKDTEEANELLFSSVAGGADLPQLPHLFVPLEDDKAQILRRLRPLEELREINALNAGEWRQILEHFGKPEAELGYLPMNANAKDGAVILDRATAQVLGIRLLQPKWGGAPTTLNPGADKMRMPLSAPYIEKG